MRLAKKNIYRSITEDTEDLSEIKAQIRRLDEELALVFEAFKGRIDFGTGVDGSRWINIAGEFQQFTSHATPDTEFNVAHTIGSIPIGAIVMWQDIAGTLYQGPTTGTNWTASQVSFKCDVASVTFNVFLVKAGGS